MLKALTYDGILFPELICKWKEGRNPRYYVVFLESQKKHIYAVKHVEMCRKGIYVYVKDRELLFRYTDQIALWTVLIDSSNYYGSWIPRRPTPPRPLWEPL